MRPREIARLVFLNILENKFKVVLTSIGIIVGAATIVLVIAVGRGGQMEVEEQFANLSAASIEITSSNSGGMFSRAGGGMTMMMPPGGGSENTNRSGSGNGNAVQGGLPGGNMAGGFAMPNLNIVNASLAYEDAEDIAFFIKDVAQATISASTSKDVLGGTMEEASSSTVAGVKPEYAEVSNLSVYIGEFITQQDEDEKAKTCVLGYNLALSMFDSVIDAYDSVITIDGISFTVGGILRPMGTVSSGISPDGAVYVPYSTASKYFFGRDISPTITVVASSINEVEKVTENVEILLGENYPGATFTISDAGSKMDAALQSSRTLSSVLLAVAIIVFVVGGIGIMNVLFVSVKERTKEIGVLKALGMSRKDVMFEFLLEATVISIVGGMLGNLISIGVIPLARQFGVRMEPITYGYLMAFLFAVGTGTIFGFYPAFKASRLIPVEALNQE